MDLRIAEPADFENIIQFYYDLTDAMQNADFHPGWKKDIYPARDFIQESINHGEVAVAVTDNQIIGAMVMNHECADGYNKAKWNADASSHEVVIIHALGISPQHQGKGAAKKMVDYAIDTSRQKGMKAIRLDVLASNTPAQKLYAGAGFVCIDTIQLYYEDTGLTDFLLYELLL